jgi:hypothetical protein
MNSTLLWPVLAWLALGSAQAIAADLHRIDRVIAREPAYQSATPLYCLVVFGPDARTRVWLVRDGDRLYADLNATGDLTEKGKCLPVKRNGEGFESVLTPPLLAGEGVPPNTRLKVKFFERQVELLGLTDQLHYVSSDGQGLFHFADRAASAPIVYFGGPWTLSPNDQYTFQRGPRGTKLSVKVGSPGLGPGTFAAVYHGEVFGRIPRSLVPEADIAFPPRVAGAPPIRTRVVLDDMC